MRMISLDELETGGAPELAQDAAASVLCRLAALQTRVAVQLANGEARRPESEDRLLDIDEAASRLGTNRQWIYRRTRDLPFVVRLGGKVRFSAQGIDRWIASKAGR